jgi:hypothetical protein
MHTDIYADEYDDPMPNATPQQRRDALADVYRHVLSRPDTRVVTAAALVKWLENPVGL